MPAGRCSSHRTDRRRAEVTVGSMHRMESGTLRHFVVNLNYTGELSMANLHTLPELCPELLVSSILWLHKILGS